MPLIELTLGDEIGFISDSLATFVDVVLIFGDII